MRLLRTPADTVQFFLRFTLGFLLFPHGAQKLLGWFGGNGYAATVGFFEAQLGIPPVITLLVILAEFVGGLLLMVGLLSRLAAVALIINMLGAIFLVNAANGFFWTDGGVEFPLLIIAVSLAVSIRGGGAYSLDRIISEGNRGLGSGASKTVQRV